MIKFTMGACDNKKTHRRKQKRTIKSFSAALPMGHQSVVGGVCSVSVASDNPAPGSNMLMGSSLSVLPSACLANTLSTNFTKINVNHSLETRALSGYPQTEDELQLMQKLMDAHDYVPVRKSRDCCIICHCPLKMESLLSNLSEVQAGNILGSIVSDGLSRTQHWICGECRQTVIAEDNKRASEGFEQDRPLVPSSNDFIRRNDIETSCSCDSCKERRQIQKEQEQELAELQKSWADLRYLLHSIYNKELSTQTNPYGGHESQSIDHCSVDKAKELIERLCAFDPHELFIQIDSTARECMIECKSRLARSCPSLPKRETSTTVSANEHPTSVNVEHIGQFVAALLDEYDSLKRVCQQIYPAVKHLEQAHLSRFKLTVELNFRHLFHAIIYADLQKHLSDIACQLRELSLTKEISACDDGFFTHLLHCYLKFDDEMTKVSVDWRECYQLIELYNDEQVAMKAKQKMMQENFENFQARHRMFEQHMMKTSNHSHCPCDDCDIVRDMVSSDIAGTNSMESNGLQSGDGVVLNYPNGRPITPPQFTYIDAQQLGIDGAGDSTASHMFVPYMPTFEFAGGEIPEEFDDGSYQDDYSEHCSPSEQSGSPEWKEQRMVAGQDSLASICGELADSKQMNSSSVDSGTRCDGSDDVDNDDADDEDDDDSESDDDSKFAATSWLPTDQRRQHQSQPQQQQQHCQCHYCYQQQITVANVIQPSMPFFLHPNTLSAFNPPQQQQHLLHYSGVPVCLAASATMLGVLQSTQAGYGSAQQPLLLPQLYQLHCPSPTLMQPQRCPGAGTTVSRGVSEAVPALGSEGVIPCNGWQDYYGVTKCSTASSLAATVGTAAAAWASVGNNPPLLHSSMASTTVTMSPVAAAWRIQSPGLTGQCPTATALFSAPSPHFIRTSCAASHQPLAYPFQNVLTQQAPVLGPQMTGVSVSSIEKVDAASVSGSALTASKSSAHNLSSSSSCNPSTSGSSPKCLTSTAKCLSSISAGNVDNKTPLAHTCRKHVGVPAACCDPSIATSLSHCSEHQHMNRIDDDDDYDEDEEESGSDESSSASNQKDGKYCECWHCEFFGHSAPPTVPTSKNYPEMRERLRLRLKKKNEQKSCTRTSEPPVPENCIKEIPQSVAPPQLSVAQVEEPVADKRMMDVDQLLEFINGTDSSKTAKTSRKAAKRARQKQRKTMERTDPVDQQLVSVTSKLSLESEQPENSCTDNKVNNFLSSAVSTGSPSESSVPQVKSLQNVLQRGRFPEHDTSNNSGVKLSTGVKAVPSTKSDVSINLKEMQLLHSSASHPVAVHSTTVTSSTANSESSMKSGSQKVRSNDKVSSVENILTQGPVRVPDETDKTSTCISSSMQSPSKSASSRSQLSEANQEQGKISPSLSKYTKDKNRLKSASDKVMQPSVGKPINGMATRASKGMKTSTPTSSISERPMLGHPLSLVACNQNGHSPTVNTKGCSGSESMQPSCNHAATPTVATPMTTKHVSASIAGTSINGSSSGQLSSQTQMAISKSNVQCSNSVVKGMPSVIEEATSSEDCKKTMLVSNGSTARAKPTATITRIHSGDSRPNHAPLAVPSISFSRPSDSSTAARVPENFPELVPSSRATTNRGQGDIASGRIKKNRRKGRGKDGLTAVDEIFLPKDNVEPGRMDDFEREIEEFKRFCFNSTPADNREKLQVNMNLKDIFAKKKTLVNGSN